MTIIQAFETGLPVRRKSKTFSYSDLFCSTVYCTPKSWFDPEFLLMMRVLTIQDIVAKDWQVKRK